jgi:hypothetical protein
LAGGEAEPELRFSPEAGPFLFRPKEPDSHSMEDRTWVSGTRSLKRGPDPEDWLSEARGCTESEDETRTADEDREIVFPCPEGKTGVAWLGGVATGTTRAASDGGEDWIEAADSPSGWGTTGVPEATPTRSGARGLTSPGLGRCRSAGGRTSGARGPEWPDWEWAAVGWAASGAKGAQDGPGPARTEGPAGNTIELHTVSGTPAARPRARQNWPTWPVWPHSKQRR